MFTLLNLHTHGHPEGEGKTGQFYSIIEWTKNEYVF